MAKLRRPTTDTRAANVPAAQSATFCIARADRQIGVAARDRLIQTRQKRFIMLEITVDHREHRRGACQHALDHRARQTAASDSFDNPDLSVAPRDLAHQSRGAIGRMIVDKHRFPSDIGEHQREPR